MNARRIARWGVSPVVLLALVGGPAAARRIENYSYERLMKEADVVVLATATASADSGERFRDPDWRAELLGVNTGFKVEATLKGEHGKGPLTVLHYRAQDGMQFVNGPRFVSFRTQRLELEIEGRKAVKASLPPPTYLLFLRARKDGRYEAVSGQIDPELAVREVFQGNTTPALLERLEKPR